MSEQLYCPNCGPRTIEQVENHFLLGNRCEDCKTDADQQIPPFVLAMQDSIEKLESLVHAFGANEINLNARIAALEKVAEAAVRMWNSDGLTDDLLQTLQNAEYSVEIGEHL